MKNKITETNAAALQKMLLDKRAELSKFKFGSTGAKTKNVKLARQLRREVAQILTKLSAAK